MTSTSSRIRTDEAIPVEMEDIDGWSNITHELTFKKSGRYNHVMHGKVIIAVLTCPGHYILVQKDDGTLEVRVWET